jgi:asparagine synthase (glutamine-hydrolysing)
LINIFDINKKNIILKVDRFSSDQLFVYLNEEQNIIVYSFDLQELLNSEYLPKKFKLNYSSISFLLSTGVVPPPYTVFKNLFKIGQGIKCKLLECNKKVKISFSEINIFSKSLERKKFDESIFLEMIFKNIKKNLVSDIPTYLFQSAGKDSNLIALAYSIHCENKNSLTCLTYGSVDDETLYAKNISNKLGFKHINLIIPKYSTNKFTNLIQDNLKNTFFPNTDNAYLGYFLYNDGFLNQKNNLIDGMGNDIYSGHIPSFNEYIMQHSSKLFSKFNFLSNYTDSLLLDEITKSKVFYTGLYGLPNFISKKIYSKYVDQRKFFENKYDFVDDYFLIRAKIRGGIIDYEKFMGKLQSFSFSNRSNVIFPFAQKNVGEYVFNTSQKLLYSKIFLKNKIFIRKILEKHLNLEIDKIGKKTFRYDYWKNILNYEEYVYYEILNCKLFNKSKIVETVEQLKKISNSRSITRNRCRALLNYLFQISIWYNHSKYIDRDI